MQWHGKVGLNAVGRKHIRKLIRFTTEKVDIIIFFYSALVIYVSKLPLGACSIRACSLASCGNGSIVNSPAVVYFTVLSQTHRRPSYFKSSTIALDTRLLLKAKMPIRDLTTELESGSNMDPSDIVD